MVVCKVAAAAVVVTMRRHDGYLAEAHAPQCMHMLAACNTVD